MLEKCCVQHFEHSSTNFTLVFLDAANFEKKKRGIYSFFVVLCLQLFTVYINWLIDCQNIVLSFVNKSKQIKKVMRLIIFCCDFMNVGRAGIISINDYNATL